MKYILFLLTVVCLIPMGLKGKEFKIEAHSIVLEEKTELILKDQDRATYTVNRTLMILNEEGAKYASLVIYYDEEFNKLSDMSVEVKDASGEVVKKYKKNDFEDYSLSDGDITSNRARVAKVSYHRYPYTVTHSYTKEFKGVMYLPRWRPQSSYKMAVDHATFQIYCEGANVHYKLIHGMPEPQVVDQGGTMLYHWQVENLGVIDYEPYSPDLELPGVLIAPEQFSIDRNEGNTRSWKDFGTFVYQLNDDRDELPEEVITKVQDLTENISDPKDKIDVLYKYLQKNTRYVSIQLGIGGWQTIEAKRVAKNGFGDCKALTNYMKSMLKVVDIPSYMALIKVNGRNIYTDFPSTQFDHVILCIPMDQDTMWLECTSSMNATGYLGSGTYDKSVLLLTPQGGMLTSTPETRSTDNMQQRTGKIVLKEEGLAQVDIQTTYTGLQQEQIRAVAHAAPRDQEDWLKDNIIPLKEDLLAFTFTESMQAGMPAYVLDYQADISRWAKKSGTRLFLALNTFEQFSQIPAEDDNRENPIELTYSYLDTDTLQYILPQHYQIEAVPEMPVSITSEFGSYKANITPQEDGSFIYTRKLQIDKMLLPAEYYNEFRNFWREVVKADKIQMVLSNRS